MIALLALGLTAIYLAAGLPVQRRLARELFTLMERSRLDHVRENEGSFIATSSVYGSELGHSRWAVLFSLLLWVVWPLCAAYVALTGSWFPDVRFKELQQQSDRLAKENAELEAKLAEPFPPTAASGASYEKPKRMSDGGWLG